MINNKTINIFELNKNENVAEHLEKVSISTNHTNCDIDLISILENDPKEINFFDSDNKKTSKNSLENHRNKSKSNLSLKNFVNLKEKFKYRLKIKLRKTPNLLKELESSNDDLVIGNNDLKNLYYNNLLNKINEKNFQNINTNIKKLSIFSKIQIL